VGVAVGGHSPLGGWTVDAPMAESPAEEAGIRRGERILAVGAQCFHTCRGAAGEASSSQGLQGIRARA